MGKRETLIYCEVVLGSIKDEEKSDVIMERKKEDFMCKHYPLLAIYYYIAFGGPLHTHLLIYIPMTIYIIEFAKLPIYIIIVNYLLFHIFLF